MRSERYLSALILATTMVGSTPNSESDLKDPNIFIKIAEWGDVDPGVRLQMLAESNYVRGKGYDDTFKASPDFSRTDLEKVEKSVASLKLIFNNEWGVDSDGLCTAWRIKTSDPDVLVFATAGHCFNILGKLSSISYSRISFDGLTFEANGDEIEYAFDFYGENDQALIKVPRPKDLPDDFNGLDWQDGLVPEKNINLLQLGYPGREVFNDVLFAPTVLSLGRRSKSNGSGLSFWTREVDLGSYPGSSGAPVFMKDKDGKLIVVGLQTDSFNSFDEKSGRYIKHSIIRTLNFSSLMGKIGVKK